MQKIEFLDTVEAVPCSKEARRSEAYKRKTGLTIKWNAGCAFQMIKKRLTWMKNWMRLEFNKLLDLFVGKFNGIFFN